MNERAANGGAGRAGDVPAGEITDSLPADLNAVDNIGPRDFPDNSRRRIPGILYAVVAVGCTVVWAMSDTSGNGNVNVGFALAAGLLGAMSLLSFTSGWKMTVDERDALVRATRAVGFAVGHASAQQVWRGVRSRPTWRIFCYSAEEPPSRRGLVLVDAIDGRIVEVLVEDNPEAPGAMPRPAGTDK